MRTVSEDFKKAVKSDNISYYGYVEVVYDMRQGDYNVTAIPTPAPLSKPNGSDIVDGNKIMKNYATLENNYFLLDGSFLVANKNVYEDIGGFMSDSTYQNITDRVITLYSNMTNSVSTNGITIYFKDNIPFSFDLQITDTDGVIRRFSVNNNSFTNRQVIFGKEITIREIILYVKSVEFADRRLRIPEISLSLDNIYQGNELISFDVTEEIDLLLENLPVNTCTVNLGNYPDENGRSPFDVLNPTGLVPYLTDNVKMTPYIGVLTETNGIEYVKMGTFYLSDWSSDSDGNATLNGQSIIGKFENETIPSDGTFLSTKFTGETLSNYLREKLGYQFDIKSGSYDNINLRDSNLLGYLQANMPLQLINYDSSENKYYRRKFYVTRDDVITQADISEEPLDRLDRRQLLQDVQYETKSVIREVDIKDMTEYTRSSGQIDTVLSDTHVLNDTEEYFWYSLDKYTDYTGATFEVSGDGNAELIDRNYYMIYVKFTGNVGDEVTVKYSGTTYDEPPTKDWVFTNDLRAGDTLSLDFTQYFDANDGNLPTVANYYLTMDPKYKISVPVKGDPSHEVGDMISIQTRYQDVNNGYKDIILTKQQFSFDGGLDCTIEGLGN